MGADVVAMLRQQYKLDMQARIQLLAKGEVVKIMEITFCCRKQEIKMSATACHENEFRNQLV